MKYKFSFIHLRHFRFEREARVNSLSYFRLLAMPTKKNMLRQQAKALLLQLATLSNKLKLLAAVNYTAFKPSDPIELYSIADSTTEGTWDNWLAIS
jgi:hypothetical protein